MTENYVYFGVTDNDPENKQVPIETRAIYDIRCVSGPNEVNYALGTLAGRMNLVFYEGKTYFKQLDALSDMADQFGDKLKFFAFTAMDSDFRGMRVE